MQGFDSDILDSLRQMSPDRFHKLLQAFLDGSDEYLENMKSSINPVNMELINISAHSLKSSSAALGFIALSENCQILEDISFNEDKMDEVSKYISIISEIYVDVRAFLVSELSKGYSVSN